VENPKAGFPQLLESSIHRSHSPDDGDLSTEETDNNTAAQAVIRTNSEGFNEPIFRNQGWS